MYNSTKMFRLESYITPIILNYVAKYVKNIRPQDAQVSLWEGDVAFQNLDLRLNVLEDELNLPFEFLSGHIHELIIHVPWTKINSEPINITINTIEFVIKLKDHDGREAASSPTNQSSPEKIERKKKSSRIEETQTGYSSPGLVNKIINNITINCNNIILKYVEEDIVVSMNIQLLSLHSAQENWYPSFVDVNPLKGLIRKIVQISDLTICLDKRNSMGQIEVCQEPILYKCSLQIRVALKSLNGCKETKLALLTNLIEMNVSSLQFPMAIRLLNLILTLKTGELKINIDTEEKSDTFDEIHSFQNELTWGSTLWNMLPNIFTEQEEEIKTDINCGSIVDFGLYIENFKFTLKSSEFINESIVGTSKKIRYTPIVSIFFNGIYCETLIDESKGWLSCRMGISKLSIEPLGQFYEEMFENYLVKSNNESKSNFIFESLFDPNYIVSKPITNINEYLSKYSEEYLKYRASCLNLNITKYKKINEESSSEDEIDEILYKFFFSSIYLCYNTITNKIIDTIIDLIAMYDYPPYLPTPNDKDVKLSPPLLEDYDSFMTKVPIKVFCFNIRNISLKIFSQDEFYSKNQNRIKTVRKIPRKFKGKLPYFILNLQFCGGKWITPQDPELLVQTTCQLPKQPSELLNACYDNIFVNIKNISVDLWDNNLKYQLVLIPTIKLKICNLLYPHLWQDQCVAKLTFNLFIQDFTLKFTKPRLILSLKLIKTMMSFDYETLIDIAESSTRIDIHQNLHELESVGKNLEISFNLFKEICFTKGYLNNLKLSIRENDLHKNIMESNEINKPTNSINWIEWTAQVPKICENSEFSPIFHLTIRNFSFFLNEFFVKFLKYTETKVHVERDFSPEREIKLGSEKNMDRKSTKKSFISSSRKISYPEETIHLSSDKEEKIQNMNINKNNEIFNSYHKMCYILKFAILNIDMNQGIIYFVDDLVNIRSNYEAAIICTPKILCKSRNCENFDFNKRFPIKNTNYTQKSFPWTCNVTSFSISLTTKEGIICQILHTIETNITVAMNHKTEIIPISNILNVQEVDQIQERCDKKIHYCADSTKKKRDLVESNSKELDIQSVKFDWSEKEILTDNVNKKNEIENTVSTDENFVHVTVPSGSPKKIDKNEICDINYSKSYETQKIARENIAYNFHIDTSPIFLEIKTEQVYFLQSNLDVLLTVLNLLGIIGNNISCENETFRIVTDSDEDTTVKEFLEMDSCSDSSTRFIQENSDNILVSIWLQWTITKIGLKIESFSDNRTTLSIEMEDFIMSLDKQVDYIKIKSKLGTLFIWHFKITESEEVKTDDCLKFNIKTNNSELPFIDLTVTIADTNSVFKKIGTHKKAELNNKLYEIIILLQSFETTLDLEKLLEFMPLISIFNKTDLYNKNTENSNRQVVAGSQLPLIYFNLCGFIIYAPVKTSQPNSSVLILKVNEVKLSPNVKNPLTRKPIRSDVYNKAAQMGLLNVRGSFIEDRQYELIVHNISMASGNWSDLLSHMKDHEKNLLNANPAFDWNHQNFAKELKLQGIFNNFVVSLTYAPMIVYENIIICGQSIELNCVTDLNAKITTEQIKLFLCMYLVLTNFSWIKNQNKFTYSGKENTDVSKMHSFIFLKENQILSTKVKELSQSSQSFDFKSKKNNTITQIVEERDTDSGIATYEKMKRRSYQKQYKKISPNEQNKTIPHEFSFLAGVFTVECFHITHDPTYKSHSVLIPLFSCTINQPSMLLSQKIYEKFFQFSLHNLTINLSVHSKIDIEENNFPANFFSTLPGKLDVSGIPPSLFSLKLKINKSQKYGVTCSVSKPIKINLQHKTIEKIASIWVAIQEHTRTDLFIRSSYSKQISHASQLKIIKRKFGNNDKICIKLDQFIIKTEEHDLYEIEVILNNLTSEIIFLNRPEKLLSTLNLDSFYIKTENKICLHPLSIKSIFNFTQEKWCKLPLITINLNMNVVQMDFGVINFQNILTALNSFNASLIQAQKILENLKLESKTLHLNDHDNTIQLNLDNLEKINLPKSSIKLDLKNKDEFYQDDLRAGAFQFVEIHDDFLIPLPYQIHIITKNHGIICWRYPQPRKIYKLHIFPIPMPIANPAEIKCQVEYFSELFKKFIFFCEFSLSETKSIEIELPKRTITANTWRVIILQSLVSIKKEYFDLSEEDNEVKSIKFDELEVTKGNNLTLHPKVLVGCMKIDTCFNQKYIPKLEILLDIAFFEMNLKNQQEKTIDRIDILNQIKLINEFSSGETFLSLQLKNIKIWTKFLTPTDYSIDSELNFNIKILDYGFCNMQHLIEETNLKNYLLVNKRSILINFISEAVKINIDPGILHTMVVSAQQWSNKFRFVDEPYDPIIARFVIINITQDLIVFGQTNTIEKIYINTQECAMYSFLSNIHGSSLTFYNKENLNECSTTFRVRFKNCTNFLKIGSKIYVIESKKLSSTQLSIYVKGQVDFLIMTKIKLKIQFRNSNIEGTHMNKSPEYQLKETGLTSFCHNVTNDEGYTIRAKFDSKEIKLWSGDIPLKANKKLPWLVKIPISGTQDFISYWFRIIIEEIVDFKTSEQTPLRVLVVIWPIYQIKSMFPRKIMFKESSFNTEEEITKRGGCLDLNLSATHETEHIVTFVENFVNNDGENQRSYNLSLKNIDWQEFFFYDEKKWTIDKCLAELQKGTEEGWPFKNLEELKIRRRCNLHKPPTKPIFKIYPSRELSCTLLLEASPWCIVINSLSCSIKIQSSETENNIQIPSNELSQLFPLKSSFFIEVDCSLGWIKSFPIYFDSKIVIENKITEYLLIQNNDEIKIFFPGNIVHKIILKSVFENGRRIFLIKPIFVLVNYSNIDFIYIPFCLLYNHKITREELGQMTAKHGMAIEGNSKIEQKCGVALDTFYNLSNKSNIKNKDSYNFYLTIFDEETKEVTIPIGLANVFNRKCISLQKKNDSIPLCVNILEKDGQYFINIFNDSLPTLEINNCTDLNFLIAQTNSNENSTDGTVKPQHDRNNFEWHQIVRNLSTLYYTPPGVYLNFPDNGSIAYNIVLALFNKELDKTKKNRWSKPLRVNVSCEVFFHIPMFGDIKIIVCNKHKTTKIFILYIEEQFEFSVKDLRSRLVSPKKNDYQYKDKDLLQRTEHDSKTYHTTSRMELICKKCNHNSSKNFIYGIEFNFCIKEIILCLSAVSEEKNFDKTEILAIYLDDLGFKYDGINNSIQLLISNVQVDNPLFSSCKYDFPVILSAQDTFNRCALLPSLYELSSEINTYDKKSLIKINLQFRKENENQELISILCKIKPIRAYVEDKFINDLFEYFTECCTENLVFCNKKKNEKRMLSKGQILIPDQIINKAFYLAEPIKLECFRIEPLSVMFSVHTCIRFYIALDHSPLELAAFERTNIVTLPIRLGYLVGMHYLSGALFGAGWVVGSLEILGSPSGLARCFTLGFKDFVTMPLEGFFRGPWGFIMGITHGSVSLVRNITAGTVNSVTKLASSVARNIDRLTFDEEHFQRTEINRRTRPQGFTEGLSQGLTSLGINMLGAVGGLARHPLEAQNPVQIVTGVGKGIVGAFTKPISGAAELVALTGHGVLHTVGFNRQPKQRSSRINYKLYTSPADSKILKLLPKVLQFDQILFFHEATLVIGNKLKPVTICMTSTVLAVLELDKNELSYVLPIERVIASFDKNDHTLINISLKPKDELVDEYMNKQFARRRIMNFLRSSKKSDPTEISIGSLEDLLDADKLRTKLDWSFYINENLGNYFLKYLNIVTLYTTKDSKKLT